MVLDGNSKVGAAKVYATEIEMAQALEIERLKTYLENIFHSSKGGTSGYSKMRAYTMEALGIKFDSKTRKYSTL